MVTVYDVAEYILTKQEAVPVMKIQKLCYYSQGWHLVWKERPLFGERIEAWANGPVIPDLFAKHRGKFLVEAGDFPGDAPNLTDDEREAVDVVLGQYGPWTPHQLSDTTHRERPWVEARSGLRSGERGSSVMRLDVMAEHFDSLTRAQAERYARTHAYDDA